MQKGNYIFNKEGIPNTNYFVYKNKNYPIKFDFFKHSSNYFLTNKQKLKHMEYIQLVDEETMRNTDFQSEWIETFINFVQCEKVLLTDSNVLCLDYLSNLYEVEALKVITKEYISTNQKNLALDIILQHQNDSKFDISSYEDIISSNINEFIEKDELIKINIPIFHRILKKLRKKNQQLNDELFEKIFGFLLKCLDKIGRSASILFSEIEIIRESYKYFNRLMSDYSNVFDFSFLNKNDFLNIYKLNKKQEEEYQETIADMQKNEVKNHQDIEKLENENKENLKRIQQYEVDEKLHEQKENSLQKEILIYRKENEDQKSKIDQQKERINELTQEIEKLKNKNSQLNQQMQEKGRLFKPTGNNDFNGIINYLRKQPNQINFTASSSVNGNCLPSNVSLYENKEKIFHSEDKPNSWICLDFNGHRIIPTDYTLRTSYGHCAQPRSWVFECSNDNANWESLDEENNQECLKGMGFIHTFKIRNQTSKEFRYIRIRSTGPDWNNWNYLILDSIEIYGKLI